MKGYIQEKSTVKFNFRLNLYEDMDIIQRLAEAENLADVIRTALAYYVRHEKEVNEKLKEEGYTRRTLVKSPRPEEAQSLS